VPADLPGREPEVPMTIQANGKRPTIPAAMLAILVGLFLLATANATFWNKAYAAFGPGLPISFFGIAVALIVIAALVLVAYPYLFKPLAIFALLAAAPAAYFTDTFGTIINAGMIENAATTTTSEAKHLFTREFIQHVLLFGVLPSLVVLWVRIRPVPFFRRLIGNFSLVLVLLLVAGGLVYSQLGTIIVALRRDHAILQTLNPSGPVSSAIKYATRAAADAKLVRAPIGTDARRNGWVSASNKPVITIVVAGETARAVNFSLNGYRRDTNPELAQLDIVNYPNVTSCGTDTAESLPCMFSDLARADYSKSKAKARESLIDVARHAGIDAVWWDNNTGDKGIAAAIKAESLTGIDDPENCADNECRDSIFLDRLETLVTSAKKDTLVVLHQIGSHGPAYYLQIGRASCRERVS
jgi:lipid A ethanolaminephosphotransferase